MSAKGKIGKLFSSLSSSMRRPIVATVTDLPLSKLLLNKKVLICAAPNGFGEAAAKKCSDLGAETVLIGMDSNCVNTLSESENATHVDSTESGSASTAHAQIDDIDCVLLCIDNCVSCEAPFTDASDCACGDQQKAKEMYFLANSIVCKELAKKRPTSVVLFERTNRSAAEMINEAVVSGYTQGLAKELRGTNIRVNHVIADMSSGKVSGNSFRSLPKEDNVNAALPLAMFLLSDASACITGQCIRQYV